jgi:hypothetical protein
MNIDNHPWKNFRAKFENKRIQIEEQKVLITGEKGHKKQKLIDKELIYIKEDDEKLMIIHRKHLDDHKKSVEMHQQNMADDLQASGIVLKQFDAINSLMVEYRKKNDIYESDLSKINEEELNSITENLDIMRQIEILRNQVQKNEKIQNEKRENFNELNKDV